MNAIVFLSFFLPCVSAFNPNGQPAIKVVTPSTFRLPVTQAADVLDAPQTLPADAMVPPLPVQSQIVKDAMASRNAMDEKKLEQFMMNEDLLGKSNPMPAQVQEIKPAQAQAVAAAEPEPFYRQPVFVHQAVTGASIAGFFASMFGAAGLVLHRRKKLAANAAAAALAAATAGATPAFAANGEQILAQSTDIVSNLPMATSLEVTFAAYLAVLLGTFLPTLFLIILYLNSEARRIGDFTEDGTFS